MTGTVLAPFTTLAAVALPYDSVNVDTDQIIPARFLKFPRAGGYGKFLFHDLRFADDGSLVPTFALNREPYRGARILVANENFGCGSSREGAVYALVDAGFRAVIAPSFGDIFFSNCLKNGVVPVRLPLESCAKLRATLKDMPGSRMTVDLVRQIVLAPEGTAHPFALDEFWRALLLQGLDDLGLTLELKAEIEAFERAYAIDRPWVVA